MKLTSIGFYGLVIFSGAATLYFANKTKKFIEPDYEKILPGVMTLGFAITTYLFIKQKDQIIYNPWVKK